MPRRRQSLAHSKPASAQTAASSATSQGRGSRNSAASRAAMSSVAVPTRAASPPEGPAAGGVTTSGDLGPLRLLELLAGAAEAALPAAIGVDRLVEGGSIEIRPERFGEIELRIGELPEQE